MTSVPAYELAQANMAYMLTPHDDPQIADYMARLDEINSLADRAPGFVWRYLTDSVENQDSYRMRFQDASRSALV